MTAIIDVKQMVQQERDNIRTDIAKLGEHQIVPKLQVILVGNNPASASYVKGKVVAAQDLGIHVTVIHLDERITQEALLAQIQRLNQDVMTHGFLVQLPLPEHINENSVIEAIDPTKDVDGFHPEHLGKMMIGLPGFLPCTPKGIMTILGYQKVDLRGKHVVVVGRSNIVGKPIAMLLLAQDATVTICHSKTEQLAELTQQADVLIVAIGQPNMISKQHIKTGAIIIDVGVNRVEGTNKLIGDVDVAAVQNIAAAITPVPGGVGPMTIMMLLVNTVQAALEQNGLNKGARE